MSREPASVKGARLLVEGRVLLELVRPGLVRAVAHGDTGAHRLEWTPAGGWSCSCPCRTPGCSHLSAVRRVVAVDLPADPTELAPASSTATPSEDP